MNRLTSIALTSVLAVAGVAFTTGCASTKTDGEITRDTARGLDNAADMIQEGEADVRDGEAMIARGDALVDQGDKIEGERLIAQGRVKRARGEEAISEGKRIRRQATANID